MSTTSRGPSRRTLVKGAAWSVPVVAVAGSAPAWAASQEVTFNNLNSACKLPGASCEGQTGVKKGYRVAMQLCTSVRGQVTIDFGTASGTLNGVPKTWAIKPDPLVITGSPDGSEVCSTVVFSLDGEPDSANGAISGAAGFTWSSSNGLSGSGTLAFSADATPPCDNCNPPAAGSSGAVIESSKTPEADVKLDQAPATTQSTTDATAPAPVEPAPAPATPAPAPADGASETSAP